MGRQKTTKGFHSQWDAFGIIQAINPNDHNPAGQALHHVPHERQVDRTSCEPIELLLWVG